MRARGIDRGQVLGAFTMRWVTLGLVLIVLVATLRQGMTVNGFFALLRQDVEPAVMTAVVVYFLAGLLLLSHGRLATLRARWTLERTRSEAAVTRRWPFYVVLLVGAVGLGALLLPFGGTFLLATALSWIIGGVFAFVLLIYRALAYGVIWLFSLLAGDAPPPPPPPPPPAAAAPAAPAAGPVPPLLPEWVGGTLFWVALAMLVAYAAFVYFGEKGTGMGWLHWLLAALQRRWAELTQSVRVRLPALARDGERAADGTLRGAQRAARRRLDNPDAQVRALYFATLRAAEEAGVPRAPAETPLRYAPRLAQEVAGADAVATEREVSAPAAPPTPSDANADANAAAVRALTDAFVTVRYAGRHADRALARRLEEQWHALQRALRARRP
jgi:hypothetical protein